MTGIILHVGVHKTASTVLQGFFSEHDAFLEARGVVYARTGRHLGAHHNLAAALRTPASLSDGWTGQHYVAALHREIELVSAPRMLLSSEDLSYCPPGAVIEAVGQRPALVIVYVRRQDSWYESMYREYVKNSAFQGSPEAFLATAPPRADYCALVESWAGAVGLERVVVRPFERSQLRGDILDDFLSVLGLPRPEGVSTRFDVNRSFGTEILSLRRLIDPALDPASQIALREAVWWADQQLTRRSAANFFSPRLRREILDRYAPSNARLARLIGRQDGRLFLEQEPTGEEPWTAPEPLDWSRAVTLLTAMMASQAVRLQQMAIEIEALKAQLSTRIDPST